MNWAYRGSGRHDEGNDMSEHTGAPTLGSAISNACRLAFEAVDRFPITVLTWLRSRHHPYDVLGDGSVIICDLCNVEWPCDESTRLDEALVKASSGSTSTNG